jgi:hypothetical protein
VSTVQITPCGATGAEILLDGVRVERCVSFSVEQRAGEPARITLDVIAIRPEIHLDNVKAARYVRLYVPSDATEEEAIEFAVEQVKRLYKEAQHE